MGLTVSREDISSFEIQDFPAKDRFIKIPVENFLDELGVIPIAPQVAMLNAINNPKYRFITGCLSRRTGKTMISNIVMFLMALVPGTHCAIVAPNYSLAK